MEGLLSVKQAAVCLGISPFTVRAWVFSRKLPHVRLSRRILFRKEDLQAFISKNVIEAREEA